MLCWCKFFFWMEVRVQRESWWFFFYLVILFVLVPASSFRELLTDSSLSAGLLRKFNNAITQQKVLENYFKCFANAETWKQVQDVWNHHHSEGQCYLRFVIQIIILRILEAQIFFFNNLFWIVPYAVVWTEVIVLIFIKLSCCCHVTFPAKECDSSLSMCKNWAMLPDSSTRAAGQINTGN